MQGGARPYTGDLNDGPSLDAACAGAGVIIATAGTRTTDYDATVQANDVAGYRRLIEAARAAGIHQFLFVSALGAHPASPIPYIAAKGDVEATLKTSGVPFTILRPSFFMDFWFFGFVFGPAQGGGPVWVFGDGRDSHSPVLADDVAALAVAAVDHPNARNRILPQLGPQPLSLADALTEYERRTGTRVEMRSFAPDSPAPGWSSLAVQLMALGSTTQTPADAAGVAEEFGIRPTSLAEYLDTVLPVTATAPGVGINRD